MGKSSADLALKVERYALPKFKVAVELAGSGGAARHGYRPGDHVTGTVRANYFLGKPVTDACEFFDDMRLNGLNICFTES